MKFNRVILLVFITALAFLLSACGAAPVTNWPSMATDGKTVYLANGSYIYNVQLSDGKDASTADGSAPLRFPAKADGKQTFYATPVLGSNGLIFIGNATPSGNLLVSESNSPFYSIDPATSSIKWTFREAKTPWMASALVSGDTVYAPAGNGKLYALSLEGVKRWEVSVSKHGLWSAPVTDGKSIILSTLDHKVFAFDPQSGAKKWETTLDNAILSAPAVSEDGSLYIGTLSGNFYALDAATGKQQWMTALQGSIWATPALQGEALYVGTTSEKTGKMYAVNAASGQVLWSRDATSAIIASPLALEDQVIYAAETGLVQSLNLDGTPKWQEDITQWQDPVTNTKVGTNVKLYTAPMFAGGLILIAPMQSEVHIIAYAPTGEHKWAFIPAK